ncbi:hypothetical protein CLV51_1021073 [Chitinophaga niastensis]|uniref:Uncharacterized protein n=1 Tax=Chitinophaga niastensis TaxID=536980 RepID=A0A2P8HPR5_CHINA|nr:hypothetical protein CLV51_1021073 [Chitinophaga niastensis]
MTTPRILMGATTFILAIAGAISTMGSNRNKSAKVLTTNGIVCTLFSTPCFGIGRVCTAGGPLHRIVWTINSNCILHKETTQL